MKKLYAAILIIGFSFFVFYSCSDPQDDLTTVPKISIHSAGFGNPSAPDFHSKYFMENGWQLKKCIECHGSNYGGGSTGSSCLTCHTQSTGPEACNTCHGDFGDPTNIAPPKDLSGNTETGFKGVGAHQSHIACNTISSPVDCYECHSAVVESIDGGQSKYVFDHIGDLPADMQFDSLANLSGNANYDFSTLQCSNTYCHGNFEKQKLESDFWFAFTGTKMEGNKFNPIWNVVNGTQAKCGTCHGELDEAGNLVSAVPKGHVESVLTNCSHCHGDVIDEQGNIIDKTKHVNGVIDTTID